MKVTACRRTHESDVFYIDTKTQYDNFFNMACAHLNADERKIRIGYKLDGAKRAPFITLGGPEAWPKLMAEVTTKNATRRTWRVEMEIVDLACVCVLDSQWV